MASIRSGCDRLSVTVLMAISRLRLCHHLDRDLQSFAATRRLRRPRSPALPLAALIAIEVSRRRRDGSWRAILRLGLATYLMILLAQLFLPFPIPPWTTPEIESGGFYRPWPFPGPT